MNVTFKFLVIILCVLGLQAMEDFVKASQEKIMLKPTLHKRNPNETLLVLITENDLDLVKYTIEEGNADISYQDYKPILLAAELGKKEIVAYLLTIKEIPDRIKNSAALKARKNNYAYVADMLELENKI